MELISIAIFSILILHIQIIWSSFPSAHSVHPRYKNSYKGQSNTTKQNQLHNVGITHWVTSFGTPMSTHTADLLPKTFSVGQITKSQMNMGDQLEADSLFNLNSKEELPHLSNINHSLAQAGRNIFPGLSQPQQQVPNESQLYHDVTSQDIALRTYLQQSRRLQQIPEQPQPPVQELQRFQSPQQSLPQIRSQLQRMQTQRQLQSQQLQQQTQQSQPPPQQFQKTTQKASQQLEMHQQKQPQQSKQQHGQFFQQALHLPQQLTQQQPQHLPQQVQQQQSHQLSQQPQQLPAQPLNIPQQNLPSPQPQNQKQPQQQGQLPPQQKQSQQPAQVVEQLHKPQQFQEDQHRAYQQFLAQRVQGQPAQFSDTPFLNVPEMHQSSLNNTVGGPLTPAEARAAAAAAAAAAETKATVRASIESAVHVMQKTSFEDVKDSDVDEGNIADDDPMGFLYFGFVCLVVGLSALMLLRRQRKAIASEQYRRLVSLCGNNTP